MANSKNILNQYFDNIYLLYINQKEVDRVKNKLYKHNIKVQYFRGLNGKRELNEKYRGFHNKERIPTIGSFGHLHSFIKIMEDALENKYKKILILESDIYFCEDFESVVEKYLKMSYKTLHLGASQHVWDKIEIIDDKYYYSNLTCGTFALALDWSVFGEYLKLLKSLSKPSDVCIFDIFNKYKGECIVAYPNPICCDVTKSEISAKRDQNLMMKKFRWYRAYEFEEVYTFSCEENKWYQFTVSITEHFGYKNGSLRLISKGVNTFPKVELPNILFIDDDEKKQIKTIEDLEKINKASFYVRTESNQVSVFSNNLFLHGISMKQVDRDTVKNNINLWVFRQYFDLTFIAYYKKYLNLDLDAVFVDRYESDKELFNNSELFSKFLSEIDIDLTRIQKDELNEEDDTKKVKVLYLMNYSPEYESIGYTIRTHQLIKHTVGKRINIEGLNRFGYPYDKRKEYYDNEVSESFEMEGVRYNKLLDGNKNRNDYNLVEYLKKYIIETIKYAYKRGVNVIHAASDYWNGIAGVYASKFLGIKCIYEVRGFWEESSISHRPDLYKSDILRMRYSMETQVSRLADKVITINRYLKEELINRGVSPGKIETLYNGVDSELFKPSFSTTAHVNLKIPKNKYDLIIGYIGTLVDYEGIEYIIRSIKILKNSGITCKFIVAGGGNELHNILNLSKKLGIHDNIMYLGKLKHSEVVNIYNIFDVVVYPRKNTKVCRTTSSSKVFEAMAMQKPVLVSNLEAWTEIVSDGETGLYFEPDNIRDLVSKLMLLAKDKKLRETLGFNAREWVVKNRSWKKIGRQLRTLYKTLIKDLVKTKQTLQIQNA